MNLTDIDPANLAAQEVELLFPEFTHATAFELGQRLVAEAQGAKLPVAIDIFAFGQVLFHVGLPGSGPDNDAWIERKRRTVLRLSQSSLRVGRSLAAAGTTIEARYLISALEYAPYGGSFPIRLTAGGGVIGTVTVSGLPQEEDHRLVVAAIAAHLGIGGARPIAAPAP